MKYLLMHTKSSNCQSPEITFTSKILILTIPKNCIICLEGLKDIAIVKDPTV